MSHFYARPKLILRKRYFKEVTTDILGPVEGKALTGWKILFGLSIIILVAGGYSLIRVWWDGIGLWGENKTVNWAWDITCFVWWIGIGHAGTLISAILLLLRQQWRNSINRAAEAMTLCAVTCSSLFIFAHLGRVWLAYWIFPFEYGLEIWPNFNSPLLWDATAILTYFLLSAIFWYAGMVPDLSLMRDRANGRKRKLLNIFAFGWDSSAWAWRRYNSFMRVMAGLLTALVVSVHSIVAMDFAVSIIPGWHSTFLPPYFVVGAILSGMAMVITILVPVRKFYGMENYITINHFESMNKIIILTSGLVGLAYMIEIFHVIYAENDVESIMFLNRAFGTFGAYYFLMIICNFIIPQLLWFKTLRRNLIFSFLLSLIINFGMWLERFVLIVTSLSRDYLPSSWVYFRPTIYTVGTFAFSIGLFMLMFLLFLRFLPFINISEIKEQMSKDRNV